MTSADELRSKLFTLYKRGITIELEDEDDHNLILRPNRLIDAEITQTVQDIKPALIQFLRLASVGAVREDGQEYLLSRLRTGSVWLAATRATLDAMPMAGLAMVSTLTPGGPVTVIEHTKLSDQFNISSDMWLRLEDVLREIFDYQGCVFDQPTTCDPDSVTVCRHCLAWKPTL